MNVAPNPAGATSLATIECDSNSYTIGEPITGSALGAHAVKHGLVEPAPIVSIVSEQGTRTGRQRFVHVKLTYGDSTDIPSRIEVGGSEMPVLKSELF